MDDIYIYTRVYVGTLFCLSNGSVTISVEYSVASSADDDVTKSCFILKPIYKVCKKPENHEGNVLPELVRNRGQVGLLAGDALWCSGRFVWSQGQ